MSSYSFLFIAFFAIVAIAFATPAVEKRRSGQGTYFEVGLGNCGQTNVDTDMIVALATTTYASGAHCGDKVTIKSNGKTHTATVRDSCVGCDAGDLDMSPSLFEKFADLDVGVIDITWSFV